MEGVIIAAIISACVALLAAFISYTHNNRVINEQKREEERKVIIKQLNAIYCPLLSYLNITEGLYKIFSENKPKNFITLTYLLNPEQEYIGKNNEKIKVVLDNTDHKILQQIIEVENNIEPLIIERSGLIKDDALMFNHDLDKLYQEESSFPMESSLLTKLIVHCRLLKLAYSGEIKGFPFRFESFTFPYQLNDELKRIIDNLNNDLKNLTK